MVADFVDSLDLNVDSEAVALSVPKVQELEDAFPYNRLWGQDEAKTQMEIYSKGVHPIPCNHNCIQNAQDEDPYTDYEQTKCGVESCDSVPLCQVPALQVVGNTSMVVQLHQKQYADAC